MLELFVLEGSDFVVLALLADSEVACPLDERDLVLVEARLERLDVVLVGLLNCLVRGEVLPAVSASAGGYCAE